MQQTKIISANHGRSEVQSRLIEKLTHAIAFAALENWGDKNCADGNLVTPKYECNIGFDGEHLISEWF